MRGRWRDYLIGAVVLVTVLVATGSNAQLNIETAPRGIQPPTIGDVSSTAPPAHHGRPKGVRHLFGAQHRGTDRAQHRGTDRAQRRGTDNEAERLNREELSRLQPGNYFSAPPSIETAPRGISPPLR
jgi:hypothetical protein